MANKIIKSRFEQEYFNKIRPEIKKELKLKNIMEVPRLVKIVLNIGISEADDKGMQKALKILQDITGQKATKRLAKKSIAAFKLREGMPIGAKVTLRKSVMYNFLDKLINLALPKVRDFHGVSKNGFDGRGNYNLGIRDWFIFPEVEFDLLKSYGMNITLQIASASDEYSRALLKKFKMPFKN